MADKLDEFFTTPETGTKPGSYGGIIHEIIEARDVRMGMFGMSNQVSHHIPYMYNWTGKQSRTAEKVREILRRLYVGGDIGQGYPGDEDNGEQSAWNTLSSLGIYPLQVGSAAVGRRVAEVHQGDRAPHPGRHRRQRAEQLGAQHLRAEAHRQR